ncbi:MAG: deoxyribonuclease IV [bacterium]
MRFGFQISIAGGFSRVVARATHLGCETIQIFSGNPRGWENKPLSSVEATKFKGEVKKEKINPVFVHMPYLPNIASPRENLYLRSIKSLEEDLMRTEKLGANYLVLHLGSRITSSEAIAIERIAQALNHGLAQVKNRVIVLVENTAGQGTAIGYSFFQIKELLGGVDNKDRVGVCLDTAHAFEAGYDLSEKEGLEKALGEFDRLIDLEKLYLLHLNDSKTPLGSRIDRHWHIGNGYIGRAGFRRIINHPELSRLPAILETPRKNDEDDLKNMSVVRDLVKHP